MNTYNSLLSLLKAEDAAAGEYNSLVDAYDSVLASVAKNRSSYGPQEERYVADMAALSEDYLAKAGAAMQRLQTARAGILAYFAEGAPADRLCPLPQDIPAAGGNQVDH